MSPDKTIAALFAQVLHMSEDELPKNQFPDGIYYVMCIYKGLSQSSGDARNNSHVGFIVLCQRGVDEQKIHALYDDLVFKELVKLKREKLGYTYDDEMEVPDAEFRAVRWTDDGVPQLKAIGSEEAMVYYKKWKIDQNKHGSSRSGIEAACDLAYLFRSINDSVRSGNYHDFLVAEEFVANAIKEAFCEGCCMKSDTKKYVEHFPQRFPPHSQKWSTTNESVHFINNAMIDKNMILWGQICINKPFIQ